MTVAGRSALITGALDRTARYVRERHQSGREISEFQVVQSSLADMVVQVETARLLIARTAVDVGTGAPDPLEASGAKCFSNEMGKRGSDLAMQLHGGYGYSEEYEIERLQRDSTVGLLLMGRLRCSASGLPRSSSDVASTSARRADRTVGSVVTRFGVREVSLCL